jgi:peroxiredoxin
MKKAALVVIIAVLVTAGLLFFAGRQRGGRHAVMQEGDQAPDFRLTALDGRTVSLSALRGKVVMVHFWATWCPPCVEEMPTLERLYRAMFGQEFELLAVSVDEGGAPAVGAFLKKNRLTLPVLLNPDRSVAALYGTLKFPETYLVDREGFVRKKIIGAADWTRPEAIGLIAELMKKK